MGKSKCKGYGYKCEKRDCNECDQYEGPSLEELEKNYCDYYCNNCKKHECWDCPEEEET